MYLNFKLQKNEQTVDKIIDNLNAALVQLWPRWLICKTIRTQFQQKLFELLQSITLIINQSLKTGTFPDNLKISKIIPLLKRGDASNVDKYRPEF